MAFDAGAVVSRMELGLSGWKKSVEEVKKDQQSMSGFAQRHSDEIKKLGKAFTIAGGVMTAALGAIVAKTANAGDEIAKLSQRTGVSTELLSGYSLAAKLADVSLEGLGGGLKLLSRNMNEASQGTGTAKDAFKELGIEVVNADGTLRDSNEVLLDVADRFSGTENGAKKTALAMDIFGRSGADLIPMLNLGRDGLQQNYEEAKRLGLIYSKEAAEGAERFNDSLTTLKGALSGAGRQIAEVLMPIVTKAVEKITDIVAKVTEWTNAHPALTSALTTVAGSVGGLMLGLGPLLRMLPKVVQGWQTLTVVLQTSTAALAATLAGLTALVGGAVMVYNSINTMIKAKSDSVEADYAMAQSNTDVGKKLREMADAAGVSRAELIKLTDAYGGNNVALQMAINKGKDQNETLQKLHGWVIKHREEVKKQDDTLKNLSTTISSKLAPALKTIETKEKTLATVVEIATDFLHKQEEQFVLTAASGARAYQTMVDSVNSALDGVIEKNKQANDNLKEETNQTTQQMSTFWDDLVRDITIGWADGIQGLIEGTISFKDFCGQTWDTIKKTFFRLIADMVTKWITDGISKLVSGAASGAASIGSSFQAVGTTVVGVVTTVVNAIKSVVTVVLDVIEAIGKAVIDIVAYAITTLAQAIATAINALAAAAPALLELGLVAAAIYTAFKLGESLVGAIGGIIGGGGGNSDITDWLKVIYDTIVLYGIALGGHLIFLGDRLVEMFPKVDNLAGCVNTARQAIWDILLILVNRVTDLGNKIINGLTAIKTAIQSIPQAAGGGASTATGLMMLHGTPDEPEYIVPHEDRGAFAATVLGGSSGPGVGGGGGSVTVQLNGPLIHTTGVSRADLERAAEDLVAIIEHQVGRLAYA